MVVDDHSVVREGVKRIIADTAGIMVIGEAANGADALSWLVAGDCDLVLLDPEPPFNGRP
jgi:two-component system, NarL family, invasion response regulator UvrY